MNRAIRLMHALKFVICHLAPHILPGAPMFQAQLASTKTSTRRTRPRAMSLGHLELQAKSQYVMDKVIVEFPKFLWFF